MEKSDIKIMLVPLEADDREQFILDNQRAFKYGALEEFGMRDDRMEEGEEVISRKTIERYINGEQAETYRIVCDGNVVGGLILQIDQQNAIMTSPVHKKRESLPNVVLRVYQHSTQDHAVK